MLFFPSVEVGNISLVMLDLEPLTVAWSCTKGGAASRVAEIGYNSEKLWQ